jgi:intracellular septation protein
MADVEGPKPGETSSGLVRTIVDFGGLAAWFGAFLVLWLGFKIPRAEALLEATWWLVGGSAAALALGLIVERRIAPLPLFAGMAALVFGGLALAFHDIRWVKIKPTAINVTLAVVMLGGLAMGKNPLKALFSQTLHLSSPAWRRLTLRYGVFFLSMAALNELVWRTQPDSTWVVFRFPGLPILSVLFALTQVPMMVKDMKAVERAAELES